MSLPTLTLTDNGDGSGATATIAGSAGGSANTILAADFAGGLTASGFALAGARTGDGPVNLALSLGYHWAYLLTSAGGASTVSAVMGFSVTNGQQSVFEKCLSAAASIVQATALAGFNPTSVVRRKLPWDRNTPHPGIFVCPAPETVDLNGALLVANSGTVIGYAVQIVVIAASNQDLAGNLGRWLRWREQLRRAFEVSPSRRPLNGLVAECAATLIEPGPVFDPAAFHNQFDVQTLTVRCVTRESRASA